MARSAPLQPIHPGNTLWSFSTADFPAYWTSLEQSDLMKRLAADWPRPQAAAELSARLSTGIRPTPTRWKLWLGYRLAVSQTPDGIGISAYPGWLLRFVDNLSIFLLRKRDAEGIAQYKDWYYTWREGFLIASTSRAYVVSCKTHPDPTPLQCRADGAPVFEWTGSSEGQIRFLPGDGFPIEGSIKVPVSDGATPITLSRAYPQPPALCITARDTATLQSMGAILANTLKRFDAWNWTTQFASTYARQSGISTDLFSFPTGAEQVSLALVSIDTSHTLPVPMFAVAARGSGATQILPTDVPVPAPSVSYEWNGFLGNMVPLLGSQMSLYTCVANDDFLMANSEPIMSDLAGRLALGPAENGDVDVVISADWKMMAKVLTSLAQFAGEYELLPRLNADDVRYTVLPKFTGLSKLGTMTLSGRSNKGRIDFTGLLFQPGGVDEP
ncbi:MAG: hypothetical protein K1Y02_14025 [Candidatus Hydrogenedentes bacterium]|nr:hypothetical protein [Candidatus Hydrogenedentota bacterium]